MSYKAKRSVPIGNIYSFLCLFTQHGTVSFSKVQTFFHIHL